MVNFHKQKAITTESTVQYRPLSDLKKTQGTKQCDQVSEILIKSIRLRERMSLDSRMYISTDGQTRVTLNAPAIVMAGA